MGESMECFSNGFSLNAMLIFYLGLLQDDYEDYDSGEEGEGVEEEGANEDDVPEIEEELITKPTTTFPESLASLSLHNTATNQSSTNDVNGEIDDDGKVGIGSAELDKQKAIGNDGVRSRSTSPPPRSPKRIEVELE